MKTIRLKIHLKSATLELPELRQFVGKDIELTVTESGGATDIEGLVEARSTLPFDFNANLGRWPDAKDDGLEQALRDWRKDDRPRDVPA